MKKLLHTLMAAACVAFLSAPLQSQPEAKYAFNFSDSDIQEVIKFVADVTGKTIIIDPRVKGKVKVISKEALPEQEFYDLFLSVLEIQGFTAIEVGDVVRVVPRKDARTSAVPVANRSNLGKAAYITQVIQLYNVSAAKVLPVLRPLAPQHAHLAAYAPSNAIIISDTVGNIARLRDIIQRIDRAGVAETDVIPLQYAQADDMVQMLQKLTASNEKDAPQNTKATMVADKRSNSILISGDEVRRKKVQELIARLDVPQPQSGNVRVIYLEYADAEEVAAVLSKVVSSISKLEPEAKGAQPSAANATVEADPATNSILITADGATLESLLPVVKRLDIRRAQVLVEAIIVEVSGGLERRLGVEWAAFKDNQVVAASQNVGALASLGSAQNSEDLATALAGVTGQTIGFGRNRDGALNFVGLINFLNSTSEANVLSTPSLLTTDNNEAEISIGQNIPIITGSFTTSTGDASNPFQTVNREDVGILLKVTPQINEGDTVILDIEQEVSSVSDSASTDGIITNERKISTKVISQDGETIILGGLISNDVQQTEQKVPLLGDIPLVGGLFRNDSTTTNRQNLMVFLRATIIRDDAAMAGATGEKYRYIREQQIRSKDDASYLINEDILPLLPVWDDVQNVVHQSVPSSSSNDEDQSNTANSGVQ